MFLLLASVWMPWGNRTNAETLSGNRSGGSSNSADTIPNYALWDFEGVPVKSFNKHDRVFFSIDDQQRLWLHHKLERGGWLSEEQVQSNVIFAAVSFADLRRVKVICITHNFK